jgi:CheY-like chemotaxis protein
MGVTSYVVRSGQEAFDLAEKTTIHAAVVDLATPRSLTDADAPPQTPASSMPGGLWILELFQRLQNSPPVVLVRSRAIVERDINRLMRDALRLGAFTVLENPVQLENLLAVFQRLLNREYQGFWPSMPDMNNDDQQTETENDN